MFFAEVFSAHISVKICLTTPGDETHIFAYISKIGIFEFWTYFQSYVFLLILYIDFYLYKISCAHKSSSSDIVIQNIYGEVDEQHCTYTYVGIGEGLGGGDRDILLFLYLKNAVHEKNLKFARNSAGSLQKHRACPRMQVHIDVSATMLLLL